MIAPASTAAQTPASRAVGRAWMCVLLLPAVVVAAFISGFLGVFLVGEILLPLLGEPVEGGQMPLWADILAMVPAFVMFALAALLASWFAHQAGSDGDRRGWVPAGFLIVLAVAFVVLNAIALND